MNTIVLVVDAVDIGAGPHRKQTFVGCKWHVDEAGTLHIVREEGRGNLAAFAAGSWSAVYDAGVVVATEVSA